MLSSLRIFVLSEKSNAKKLQSSLQWEQSCSTFVWVSFNTSWKQTVLTKSQSSELESAKQIAYNSYFESEALFSLVYHWHGDSPTEYIHISRVHASACTLTGIRLWCRPAWSPVPPSRVQTCNLFGPPPNQGPNRPLKPVWVIWWLLWSFHGGLDKECKKKYCIKSLIQIQT